MRTYRTSAPTARGIDATEKRELMELLLGRTLPTSGNTNLPCPLHTDRRPSMSVHASGLWKCHSCGRGGNAVNLAAELWGLEARRDYALIAERLRSLRGGRRG